MGDDRTLTIARRLDDLDERLRGIETWARARHDYQSLATPTPRASAGEEAPTVAPPIASPGFPVVPQPAPSVTPTPPTTVSSAPRPTVPEPATVTPASAATEGGLAPPSEPEPVWSFSDLEQLLSGRVLAWLGGLAILVGAVFFLGLAFTRGWIGPAGRVGIGLGAGVALFAGGAWFFERRERLFGHVLVATGLGAVSLSLVAATRLYDLVPVELGLSAALLTAAVAAVVAVRADSQIVAGYGLVTALLAPPLLGAAPSAATIGFLAAALAGTTAIALFRSWSWLPTVAFLLSAPQLARWITEDPPLAAGMTALAGFWTLHALAAGGEEFRARRRRLSPTSATLLLANAAFGVAVGFALLDSGDALRARGLFLLIVALAHFLLGASFLADEGDGHPFGLLAVGTGVAALTLAIPVQLGGPVVPLAWAAEGAALAWVYARRKHGYSGGASIVLGALAVGHLLLFEYPIGELFGDGAGARPFPNAAFGTLGFLLLAFAVAGYFVRSRAIRAALTMVGLTLAVYAVPFELSGLGTLAGWATLGVLAVALSRALALLPDDRAEPEGWDERLALPLVPGVLAGWLAAVHALAVELPLLDLLLAGGALPPAPPAAERPAAAGILIVASLAVAALAAAPLVRRLAVVAAFGVAAYLLPFEFGAAAVVVGWSALGLLLVLLPRWDRAGAPVFLSAAAGILGLGLWLTLGAVAPLGRLQVDARPGILGSPFWNGATAALGALVIVLAVSWRLYRPHPATRWLAVGAGALAVYVLSIGVVDAFQARVVAGADLAALRKGAQVSLSILWAALGGAAFIAGVARWAAPLRLFGLALLALATTKVFLYDLASLDATYRVPSFIGLGILLLASSYAYQRLKPQAGPGGTEQGA